MSIAQLPGDHAKLARFGKTRQPRQMSTPTKELKSPSWSERILLISAAAIIFLTLFPFRFALHVRGSEGMFPFFHGAMGKDAGWFDVFLNVLLFVPFGFGLAEKLRERGKSLAATAALALAVGALFSYTVEVLQIYIPSRDSGWEDVITNSSGSVMGVLGYELCGRWVVDHHGTAENSLGRLLRPFTAAVLLLAYFGIWFAVSRHLQATTRLSGWSPNPILVVGNDTWTRPWQAWKGQVLRLELWDPRPPGCRGTLLDHRVETPLPPRRLRSLRQWEPSICPPVHRPRIG